MERSSIYFIAEHILDNLYCYLECFVLADQLTSGESSSQSIKIYLTQ